MVRNERWYDWFGILIRLAIGQFQWLTMLVNLFMQKIYNLMRIKVDTREYPFLHAIAIIINHLFIPRYLSIDVREVVGIW